MGFKKPEPETTIAPADRLHGSDTVIVKERKRKLTEAKRRRAYRALPETAKHIANL